MTFKLREVVKPYKKTIGFAAVSLMAAAAASERGKAVAFMVPLRLQGLVCGTNHHCPFIYEPNSLNCWLAFDFVVQARCRVSSSC